MVFHVIVLVIFFIQLIRFLRLFESCHAPTIYGSGSKFTESVIRKCPSLTQVYKPPAIWGKCGHIQTMIYGKLGRFNVPSPAGERVYKTLSSGETITFDAFEPLRPHKNGDYTILVCPGIANSAEKAYMKTFIDYAMKGGFRVVVLNHIGSLAKVKLTSPKIFTYGDTKYFSAMVNSVQERFSNTTFLIVGYSMGGNIAMKYLGENPDQQKKFICGVSLCQGYDAVRSTEPMKYGFRRLYNRMITTNMKKILEPHWDDLFPINREESHFNEALVRSAKCLYDLEEGLLRRIDGHKSVLEYMDKASCSYVIHKIYIPVLLVNTEDDPVVVNDIHDIPKAYSESHPNAIFATFKFGGHLGYYTGSFYKPDKLTLVEKLIVEYFNSVIELKSENMHLE